MILAVCMIAEISHQEQTYSQIEISEPKWNAQPNFAVTSLSKVKQQRFHSG